MSVYFPFHMIYTTVYPSQHPTCLATPKSYDTMKLSVDDIYTHTNKETINKILIYQYITQTLWKRQKHIYIQQYTGLHQILK